MVATHITHVRNNPPGAYGGYLKFTIYDCENNELFSSGENS